MKHLDLEVNFSKCEHDRLLSVCNDCFAPVMDSFVKNIIDRYTEEGAEEPHIHSVEFLRKT